MSHSVNVSTRPGVAFHDHPAKHSNGGPALGKWQLPTLKRSCTNRLRLRSLHEPFAACGPLTGSGALTASSASHVRRGRAAGVRVYQVAREHVLRLRVQQPRLALQVPAQTAPGLSDALHCKTRRMPLQRAGRRVGACMLSRRRLWRVGARKQAAEHSAQPKQQPQRQESMRPAGRGGWSWAAAHRLSRRVVDALKPSEGSTLRLLVRQACTSARTLLASTLPSSTPHWSNELMPQMKPCAAAQGFICRTLRAPRRLQQCPGAAAGAARAAARAGCRAARAGRAAGHRWCERHNGASARRPMPRRGHADRPRLNKLLQTARHQALHPLQMMERHRQPVRSGRAARLPPSRLEGTGAPARRCGSRTATGSGPS
jgi:hypothetical protein